MRKFGMFYDYCNRAELSEAERLGAIISYTHGRTASIKEVNNSELHALTEWAKEREGEKNRAMRGRIIFCLITLGYKTDKGDADWVRINKYVSEHGGDANPKKKILHKLKHSELKKMTTIVEQYYRTVTNKINEPSKSS